MELQIESTTKIVYLNGVPARVWEGHTSSGIPVHCYITRVAVAEDKDQAQFAAELLECRKPSPAIESLPLSMIL